MKNCFFVILNFLFCVVVINANAQNNDPSLKKIDSEIPQNVYQYTENLFSGSVPNEEPAFVELKELGIQTIISVDGAKPKVELAKKHGMRYVHIPVQYREITQDQSHIIAKAVRDLTPPIYIHCHQGKHRAPTAASLSMVLLGKWDNQSAINAMETTGTGKYYVGLYQTVNKAQPLDKKVLDELQVEFVESAEVNSVIETMVQMQEIYDNLKQIQQNNWQVIREKELDPKHEALQMREIFYEFNRTGAAKDKENMYRNMVTNGEGAAISLQNALNDWKPVPGEEPPKKLRNLMNRITRNCAACHTVFRNTPR